MGVHLKNEWLKIFNLNMTKQKKNLCLNIFE